MTALQESLSKCKVAENTLYLPPISDGMLPNYQEVKTALMNAGAKYNRNTFVFPKDAKPYIDRLMNGSKINIKKEFQFFATPAALAEELVRKADIYASHKILEPSAGQGAIVNAIAREISDDVYVDCCELMDINRNVLNEHRNIRFICNDFLQIPKRYHGLYERIIANPPFSKNQDIDHIMRMYECLADGGRLVSIASRSWKEGSQKKQVMFREWLNEVKASIEEIKNGAFKESGTTVGGYIIIIDKHVNANEKNKLKGSRTNKKRPLQRKDRVYIPQLEEPTYYVDQLIKSFKQGLKNLHKLKVMLNA